MTEGNRKRKGFTKAKLVMPFYRGAAKPFSAVQYGTSSHNNKLIKPTSITNHLENNRKTIIEQQQLQLHQAYHHHHHHHHRHHEPKSSSSFSLIVNHDQVVPQQPKQKVTFVIPQSTGRDSSSCGGSLFDNPYGVVADESVDIKAATYISCVQERFRLERLNSERT